MTLSAVKLPTTNYLRVAPFVMHFHIHKLENDWIKKTEGNFSCRNVEKKKFPTEYFQILPHVQFFKKKISHHVKAINDKNQLSRALNISKCKEKLSELKELHVFNRESLFIEKIWSFKDSIGCRKCYRC